MSTHRAYHLLAGLLIGTAIAVTSFVSLAPSAAHGAPVTGCTGAYGWPVKPFDRLHPIRGSFGDPRTKFAGPPTQRTLLASGGSFSFHQGVDISAADNTVIYPVADGIVTRVTHEWIRVDCENGRAFEYWHIHPVVRVGQHVIAGSTPLGRIVRPAGHVHLTQLRDGKAVNPVAVGRLTPSRDRTVPVVRSISLRRPGASGDEMPQFVRGRVDLLVEAYDTPDLPVAGLWRNLPVTPAMITWRLEQWNGKVAVPNRVARDVRDGVPTNDAFWAAYARGTCQNMAVFGPHFAWLQSGRYVFRLGAKPFDSRTLHDGVYDLIVSVSDVAGNHSSQDLRFTNRQPAGLDWLVDPKAGTKGDASGRRIAPRVTREAIKASVRPVTERSPYTV